MFGAPTYWFYEMSHAALNPSRAVADAARLFYKNPTTRCPIPPSASPWPRAWNCSSARRGATASRNGTSPPPWSAASACRCIISSRLGAALLPPVAFRARLRAPAAPSAAAPADRRADVGALPDAAARHRRGLPAQPRRLHHRVGRRAHGAGVGGPLRSRRLHRLPDLDPASARRRHPHHRGVPALRCRCSPRSRAWRPRTTPTCPIPWC